jgi:hypothetical protein
VAESDGQSIRPNWSDWLIAFTSGVVALLPNPAVAAIGSQLVAPVLKMTLALDKDSWERRGQRGARAVAIAANEAGYEWEEFSQRVRSSDARSELCARVLDAAAHTVDLETKVDALGRVLAMGIRDDAKFDEAVMLADALRDLESPHVRVLEVIQAAPQPPHGSVAPLAEGVGWTHEHLNATFPELSHVMFPIVNVLVRHALLRDVAAGTLAGAGGTARWVTSPLGEQILSVLAPLATPAQAGS